MSYCSGLLRSQIVKDETVLILSTLQLYFVLNLLEFPPSHNIVIIKAVCYICCQPLVLS